MPWRWNNHLTTTIPMSVLEQHVQCQQQSLPIRMTGMDLNALGQQHHSPLR